MFRQISQSGYEKLSHDSARKSNLENEDQIKTKCHYLFCHHLPNLGTRFILRGVEL
jgi:hypothetical protein